MLTLILFLVLLSLIIVIHEFGHLLAAKAFGVYCHEFSLGMGPKIYAKKFKETTYSIRAIPMGGFVAMAGDSENALESEVDVDVPQERTLKGVAAWKRIIIMMAGIIMNIFLAIFVIAMVLLHNGYYGVSPDTTISNVTAGMPAEEAGIKAGDKIVEITFANGISSKPDTVDDLRAFLYTYDGNGPVEVTVERDGETLVFSLLPVYDESSEMYVIGVESNTIQVVEINIFNCWYYAFDYAIYIMKVIFMSLSQLLRGFGLENLSGPVGMYQATNEAVNMGIETYFLMLAIISLNVGIFNALPLPIMDGGRVLLLIIEMIMGRPISKKMEESLMTASMLLLLALVVFATFMDVSRLF